MSKNYKYKFSVVIPIYNVEKYLEETILSVINQSIGFKNNIQLILVNDGSTDNSQAICLKYKQLFPENILYISKKNNGVSSARNSGLKLAEGKYINFLDSDDKWELDVFKKVYNFFERNSKKIDVVACRQKFFEAKKGYHKLDYKFHKNQIIDITKDYQYIQLSTSSAFVKTEIMKKYTYDIKLKYAEDATLIGQLLMEKSKYGILRDAIYYYRKRYDETSAIQNREGNKSWYFDTIKYGYEILIKKSIKEYGRVIPYFQYQIMYDIQWRLNVDVSKYLSTEEIQQYLNLIIKLLSYIDDKIICEQKYLWVEYKILALCLKYKKDIRKEFIEKDGNIYFNGLKVYSTKRKSLIKLTNLSIENKQIQICGEINCILSNDDYSIYFDTSNGEHIKILEEAIINSRPSLIGDIKNYKKFIVKINIKDDIKIKPVIEYKTKSKDLTINDSKLKIDFNDKWNIQCNNTEIKIGKNNKKHIKEVVKITSQKKYVCKKSLFKTLIKLRYKILSIKINKNKIRIIILAYLKNKYAININQKKIFIDDVLAQQINIKEYRNDISKYKMLKKKNIYCISFEMTDILKDVSKINGKTRISLQIGNRKIEYRIGLKTYIKNKRYYYSPIKSIYKDDYALHFRRTLNGNLVLVKRKKENIEYTSKFKFFEHTFISKIFYYSGKILKKIRKNSINLFYEKFSEKVEEGTFDLFIKIRNESKSKSYFIIDEKTEDYKKIKNEKNIVKKYSLKYYWLIYNANNFISTEAPIHLNILRSNNKYLRRALMDGKFVFLQHGITYLKCQGTGSTFAKNKEGEASYIIVGSEKEKYAVKRMLGLEEDRILKTGLPIFDKIKHKHIKNNSEDIVTIMLTWKPYEEQLYNFEESTYYQNTVEVYNMFTKYIDKEKIKIVAHPKVYELLNATDIKESLWQGKISEVLNMTKLLITDYSSVCYNAFYQGAGVIFYQPDLEKYELENGKLVPNDDEYIGNRVFKLEQLEELLKKVVSNGKIELEKIRTKEFEERYKLINEFSDGKNIDRIYKCLENLNII